MKKALVVLAMVSVMQVSLKSFAEGSLYEKCRECLTNIVHELTAPDDEDDQSARQDASNFGIALLFLTLTWPY